MHRLFGKPKAKVEAPTLDDASGSIGKRIEDLDKKINSLNQELKRFNEQIKKTRGPAQQNIKRRAMETLKRKRMYEGQRDQLAGQQFNIDQTTFAIETVKSTQTTVAAMSTASKTLKKEQKKLDISEIEDMQDEMEDMLEDVGEISDILGRSYGLPDGLEEEDLEAELACLEDELEDEAIFGNAETEDVAQQQEVPGLQNYESPYISSMPSQPIQEIKIDQQEQQQQPVGAQSNTLV